MAIPKNSKNLYRDTVMGKNKKNKQPKSKGNFEAQDSDTVGTGVNLRQEARDAASMDNKQGVKAATEAQKTALAKSAIKPTSVPTLKRPDQDTLSLADRTGSGGRVNKKNRVEQLKAGVASSRAKGKVRAASRAKGTTLAADRKAGVAPKKAKKAGVASSKKAKMRTKKMMSGGMAEMPKYSAGKSVRGYGMARGGKVCKMR